MEQSTEAKSSITLPGWAVRLICVGICAIGCSLMLYAFYWPVSVAIGFAYFMGSIAGESRKNNS